MTVGIRCTGALESSSCIARVCTLVRPATFQRRCSMLLQSTRSYLPLPPVRFMLYIRLCLRQLTFLALNWHVQAARCGLLSCGRHTMYLHRWKLF